MTNISCIITSFNNKKYLSNAIDSVLNQTIQLHEIIIADDFSSDGSQEIIREYASKHKQITTIFREKNLGVGANRDLAVRQARGELVTTLDGDDTFDQNKIEYEYALLSDSIDDIAYSDIKIIDEKSGNTNIQSLGCFDSLKSYSDQTKWVSMRLGPIPRDMLLAKTTYIATGGQSHVLSTHEDWDFKLRLIAQNKTWKYTGKIGTCYLRTGGGLSQNKKTLLNRLMNQYRVLQINSKHIIGNTSSFSFYSCYLAVTKRWLKEIVVK